jgi:hypothetical protein
VRAQDEVDAALRLERAHVEIPPQGADRVDADLVAERLEDVEVRVDVPGRAVRVAEQLAREGDRGPLLADSARAVEEIRVRGAFGDRGAKEALRLVLLRKRLEAVHG